MILMLMLLSDSGCQRPAALKRSSSIAETPSLCFMISGGYENICCDSSSILSDSLLLNQSVWWTGGADVDSIALFGLDCLVNTSMSIRYKPLSHELTKPRIGLTLKAVVWSHPNSDINSDNLSLMLNVILYSNGQIFSHLNLKQFFSFLTFI